MACLDSGGGGRGGLVKMIFMSLFGLFGTQLYPLMFHFFRLISYNLLDRQEYPPKVFPKQTSWIGEETLQSDNLHFNDNSSSVHTVQVIIAAITALFTGGTGLMAICREKVLTMKIWSLVMMLITFVTGLGSYTLPNMVNIRQLILPLIGGGLSSLVTFFYSILVQRRRDREPYGGYNRDYNSSSPASSMFNSNNNNNNNNNNLFGTNPKKQQQPSQKITNPYMDPYNSKPIPITQETYYDPLNYNPQYNSPYNPQLNRSYNPKRPY